MSTVTTAFPTRKRKGKLHYVKKSERSFKLDRLLCSIPNFIVKPVTYLSAATAAKRVEQHQGGFYAGRHSGHAPWPPPEATATTSLSLSE